MRGQLRPVGEQVIVVTAKGADPLGAAIAEAAAKQGAAVALAGSDEAAVRKACAAIVAAGGRAHPVIGDPSTAEGCERIARAAAARFDRIDGWIDATGGEAGLAFAAATLVRHLTARGGAGALVGFGRRLPRAAATELRRGRGAVAATVIGLPRGLRAGVASEAAVQAALYALVRPMGRLIVAPRGRRLTALSEASKHRDVMLGVGLLALAGVAVWLNRGRIVEAARPRVARAVRAPIARAARRWPLQAARIANEPPRRALNFARIRR